MEKKLKVAVAGLTIGASHAANYAASETVGEVILCDIDESKLDSVGDKHGISKKYKDFDAMLSIEKPDAVSIAVPNYLHLPFACKALEAGAHVLCEKPMARNSEEAEKMLRCAERSGKKLMINFNQRFQKETRILKSIIDKGMLGEIYYVRTIWQRRRGIPWWYPLENGNEACGGGALIDLGVHVLDRAMWLCGYPEPSWVLGNTFGEVSRAQAECRGYKKYELDDMGVAMIRMSNGVMLEVEASWAGNRENELVMTRIYGTRGGAVLHSVVGPDKNGYNKLFLDKDGEVEDVDIDAGLTPDVSFVNIRQAFLDAVANDTEVPCTPQQGLMINKMLDAIYKSGKTGDPVKF